MHAKPFESRMPKALAVILDALETCFAVKPKVRGALKAGSGLSNTCPFIPESGQIGYEADSLKTRALKGVKALLASLETYCVKFSSGQGVQKRFQGGAV